MIVFYLIGSRGTSSTTPPTHPSTDLDLHLLCRSATKHKAHVKSLLETGHSSEASSGNRNAFQVLCNSLSGVVAAVAYRATREVRLVPLLYLSAECHTSADAFFAHCTGEHAPLVLDPAS